MADFNRLQEGKSSNTKEELSQNGTRKKKRSKNQAAIRTDPSFEKDDKNKLKKKRKNFIDDIPIKETSDSYKANLSNKRKSSDEKENLGYRLKKIKSKLLRIWDDCDVDENREDDNPGESSEIDDFVVDDKPKAEKSKQTNKPNLADAASQCEYDLFGDISSSSEEDDGEEHGKRSQATDHKKVSKSKFEDYKPSELNRDIKIRKTDTPERMQLREVPIKFPENSDELNEEAKWIYEQAFCKPTILSQNGFLSKERLQKGLETIPKIRRTLMYLREQNLEVPFIAFYRKEYIQPELNINDLWRIYKFDEKWCSFKQQKDHILSLLQGIRTQQEEKTSDLYTIKDSDIKYLKEVQTMVELQDVRNHLFLHHKQELKNLQEKERERKRIENQEEKVEHFKPVNRCDFYTLYKNAGLGVLVNKFGLSSQKLALNLRDHYPHHKVKQETSSVKDIAKQYIGSKFKTTSDVMKAAQSMAAIQISKEPIIKSCIREAFFKTATITVTLSKHGVAVIDKSHNCYNMKHFKNKPVNELTGDQFLKLDSAQEENLLVVTINSGINGYNCDSLKHEVKKFYVRPERIKNVQDWNRVRVGCVETAFEKYIIPDLKTELRYILRQEAKESILESCCKKIYQEMKVAPYQVQFSEWNASKGLRVMAIAYGLDKSASPFLCVVTPDGDVAKFLKLPNLFHRQTELKDFIRYQKPHVIVIGGESKEALMIGKFTNQAITKLVASHRFPKIAVEIIDNELAKVYANSERGMKDFPAYPELLRQAISLARKMQDPLVEYAQLFNTHEDILGLEFHPLQKRIPKEELLSNLLLEFVNRTNEVGVDINKAIKDSRTSNLVQFVGGFGPRKAQHLLEVLKQMGPTQIENRSQLVTKCHLGPNAYVNCSGFFKIDTDSLSDDINPLDGSRVHPEGYDWAVQMAIDALDLDSRYTNSNDALREVLKTPEKLDDLDLAEYAVELERQEWGYKYITVYDIKAELHSRFKDLRSPYVSPNSFQLFCILNKLAPNTLARGGFIKGEVSQILFSKPNQLQMKNANPRRNNRTNLLQCPFCYENFDELFTVRSHIKTTCRGKATGVKLRLDYGILGYIHWTNLRDSFIKALEEHVSIGEVLDCRMYGVDLDKFTVLCTSKASDLENRNTKRFLNSGIP